MVAESLIWQLNNIFGYRNALKIAPVVTYRPKNLQYIEEVGGLKHIRLPSLNSNTYNNDENFIIHEPSIYENMNISTTKNFIQMKHV